MTRAACGDCAEEDRPRRLARIKKSERKMFFIKNEAKGKKVHLHDDLIGSKNEFLTLSGEQKEDYFATLIILPMSIQPFTEQEINKFRSETRGTAEKIHFNNAGSSLPPDEVVRTVIDYLNDEAAIGSGYEAEYKYREPPGRCVFADGQADQCRKG